MYLYPDLWRYRPQALKYPGQPLNLILLKLSTLKSTHNYRFKTNKRCWHLIYGSGENWFFWELWTRFGFWTGSTVWTRRPHILQLVGRQRKSEPQNFSYQSLHPHSTIYYTHKDKDEDEDEDKTKTKTNTKTKTETKWATELFLSKFAPPLTHFPADNRAKHRKDVFLKTQTHYFTHKRGYKQTKIYSLLIFPFSVKCSSDVSFFTVTTFLSLVANWKRRRLLAWIWKLW